MAKTDPQWAIVYTRLSPRPESDGQSLALQDERCQWWCQSQGLSIAATYADPEASGADPDRPGLARAVAHATTLKCALVVLKLDRLTRDVRKCLDLADDANRNGWQLVSVSENIDTRSAAGRMFLTLLAAFASWYRESVAERTREANLRYQRQGIVMTREDRLPYGYRLNGPDPSGARTKTQKPRRLMVPDEAEQAICRRIHELRAAGLTVAAIRRQLAAEGSKCRGGPFYPGTVNAILGRKPQPAPAGETTEEK